MYTIYKFITDNNICIAYDNNIHWCYMQLIDIKYNKQILLYE